MADLLDFFDFFLIGYVTAALTKNGSCPIGRAARSCWPPAWRGPRRLYLGLARRSDRPSHGVHLVGGYDLARHRNHGLYAGTNALIPGWLFLVFFRVFVGIGNAGIFTIDLPLVQEFIPAYKRGWVSALVTTLLPGGGMLAGLVASWLLPIIGWRYLFLVGLSPLVLVFMIRYWVPESPRWLMRMGRHRGGAPLARLGVDDRSQGDHLAADAADARTDALARAVQIPEAGRRRCLTGLTQTGGASFGLWGATLLVIVLNTTPAHAAFLMVFTGVSGILGRFFITALIEPLGRRGAGPSPAEWRRC